MCVCKRGREEKRNEWVDKKSVISERLTDLTSKLPSTASHHLFITVVFFLLQSLFLYVT